MANDNLLDLLAHLIHVNRDVETGLLAASGDIGNSELSTLFGRYAAQHAKFIPELQDEIQRLNGEPIEEKSGGVLHEGWVNLKSAFSGHSGAGLIASCESGEKSAEIAYTDAIDATPGGQTRTLLMKQRDQVLQFRAHLCRLLGETKDGVEFQRNE